MAKITVPEAVAQMLAVVDRLCEAYPHRAFTLDGRLVGDIGEVLAEDAYELTLHQRLEPRHDATSAGREVQIKATMKDKLTFPSTHVPQYYLGLKLRRDGTFTEVFNGPGEIASQTVAKRARPKNGGLHSVSVSSLRTLQSLVPEGQKIPLRTRTLTDAASRARVQAGAPEKVALKVMRDATSPREVKLNIERRGDSAPQRVRLKVGKQASPRPSGGTKPPKGD